MDEMITLKADCEKCAALCCVALHIDESSSFKISKPAGEACPNLNANGACVIHNDLKSYGFSGCVSYDCLGAGQRVTQEVFGGRSWLAEDELRERMTRAFMVMTRIHALLEMLNEAKKLPLDANEQRALADLAAMLNPTEGWSEESLRRAPIDQMVSDVKSFLRTLKRHVTAKNTA